MKRQFMKSLGAFCVGVMTLFAASSCYDDLELRNEISDLNQGLEDLKARVEALETKLNSELGKIQRLFQEADAAIEAKIQVASVETNADGKIVITLTDGDTFEVEPADRNTNPILTIVEDGGVQYWATVDAAGKATSIGIPVTHTDIEFKFEENVIYYTLDGGKNWVKVATIPEDAAAPIITNVTYTDKTATFYLGDYSFTVDIAEPLSFEIRSGKVYFQSEGTQKVAVKTSGVTDVTVMAAPKGWWAEVNSDGQIEITAPDYETTISDGYWNDDGTEYIEIPATAAASGFVKVHACGADGKCIVGKIAVEVAKNPLVINVYGGNAYYEIVGESWWYNIFFYGISTKATFEADVQPILKALSDGDYSVYDNYANCGEGTYTAPIAELLGSEPVLGEEYIVWAVMENNNVITYTMDDVMYKYYALTDVKITENEAARTAYNVEVTVEVTGAESYVALAMPGLYVEYEEDVYGYQEQMAMAMASGSYFGKLYTENYTGSALDIAAGTGFSMTGNYAPNTDIYVLILPVDGRPAELYTADDVVVAKFKTASLLPGGVIDATAEQVKEYMGKVFSYEDWQYHDELIKLDPYTQLGVALTPSFTEGWISFYYRFMSDDEWSLYGSDDALIVTKLLEGYGMTPEDYTDDFPAYLTTDVNPGEKVHFAAFFVDEDGKYGQIAKVSLESETLEYSAMTLEVTHNLQNGVLANTETLELTLTPSETASKYMYVLQQTNYYNPFEGMDASALAEEIFFSSNAVTVDAAELTDGKLYIDGHEYGNSYMFAIIACDANGAPMVEAVSFEYESRFQLDEVISDPDAFVGEPVIEIHIPTTLGEADGICYYWEDQSEWGRGYYYRYYINYTVTPAEGTQVKSLLLNTADYSNLDSTAEGRASQLWQGTFGDYYSYVHTEPVASTTNPRQFGHYQDGAAPSVILMVSWTDADGNYYYKEVDLSEDLAALKANLDADLGLGEEKATSPDGYQWKFTWEDMFGAPSVLDFGVTTEGILAVACDMETMFGPDGIPAEMIGLYMQYMAWEYTVTPTDETSGVIEISSTNMFGEVETTSGTYTDFDGTTMKVTFEMLYLENVEMTLATETVPLYIEQGGIM